MGTAPARAVYRRQRVEGRPLDENELVERAQRGDERAFEEIVERYSDLVFRTALAVAGRPADAEEAAQDAFVKAHAALGRFRAGEPLRPWLLRIAGNEARNRVRSAGRHTSLQLRVTEAARTGGAAPSPEAAALAAEERYRLLEALNASDPDDRAVIALRFLLDLSVAETAATLGLPEGTVKSRLSRALSRLRARLQGEAVHA